MAGVAGIRVAADVDRPQLRRATWLRTWAASPLAALTAADVEAMFTAVTRDETALGRPVSAATLHRIPATLHAALNGAVRAGLIGVNPGGFPELPKAARPRPQVWAARADRALAGRRLAVGGRVWTAAQTALFLRHVRGHRLYALFHLIALRGLRGARPPGYGGATWTSTPGRPWRSSCSRARAQAADRAGCGGKPVDPDRLSVQPQLQVGTLCNRSPRREGRWRARQGYSACWYSRSCTQRRWRPPAAGNHAGVNLKRP